MKLGIVVTLPYKRRFYFHTGRIGTLLFFDFLLTFMPKFYRMIASTCMEVKNGRHKPKNY